MRGFERSEPIRGGALFVSLTGALPRHGGVSVSIRFGVGAVDFGRAKLCCDLVEGLV